MSKVSVIIPTYNRKALLSRAIDSVLNQTYQDFELIIVDDASTDGTVDIIDDYQDSRIKYICLKKNSGPAVARNVGIEAASGEYIAFQDSDDEWYPQKLEKQVCCMDEAPNDVAIVFCRYLYINKSQGLEGICPSKTIKQEDIEFDNLLYKNHIGGPTILARKSCLYEVGGFNAELKSLEDYDLILSITERYKAVMIDEVLMTAYGYDNGVSSNVINYFNARLYLLKKYRSQIFYYGLTNDIKKEIISRARSCGLEEAVREQIENITHENPVCNKKVSIVVPCYNSKEFISDCLASIERQTIGIDNLEVILVNDASTDETEDILLAFEQKYPESVMVINLEKNMQQGGARNVGISYASGEYLAFLNSDDSVFDNTYERLYNTAKEYNVDILQYNNDDAKIIKEPALYIIETLGERRRLVLGDILTAGCTNKFYRLSMVKDVNSRFAENIIFEEQPFVYPLFFYANVIYMMPEVLYKVRMHSNSTMSKTAREKNSILNHPESQMILLKDLIKRKWIIDSFYKEISAYFIWNYYIETIIIAGQNKLTIDAKYFSNMQKNILDIFPDYMENEYICFDESPYFPILNSLKMKFNQNEVNVFCEECAEKKSEVKNSDIKKSEHKIAVLDWPCFMKESTVNAFKNMGYEVSFFFHEDYQKYESESFVRKFREYSKSENPEIWFSYNYYPILAKCCYEINKKYISIVYDSPYLMIYSDTIKLSTNRVYLFDRTLVKEFNDNGIHNVNYTILPGDVDRVNLLLQQECDFSRVKCDVSFVGTLYNEENNYYNGLIQNATGYLKGYLDGIIRSQKELYDINLIDRLITDDILSEMKKAYPLTKEDDINEPEIYRYVDYILMRKVTQLQRIGLLESLGKLSLERGYNARLFTVNDLANIPGITNMGIASYETEMNKVFYNSKINLNISLRSIRSGIPLRCIDVMTSGGFLLSNYQEDLCADFILGEDFDCFSSEDEMLGKIEYYLSHDHIRREIAENAKRKIAQKYSFTDVFSKILSE